MHTTVRITEETRSLLKELAASERASMQEVLERAVEAYRRRRFLEAINEGYAVLQSDPAGRAELEAEQKLWDRTLGDGLPAGDTWVEPTEGGPKPRRAARAQAAKARRRK